MKLMALTSDDHDRWNSFVIKNFPPVGAFLQSYEWGDFKEALHGKVCRFAIEDSDEWIGCFQVELHSLPLGFSYGYAPRGPVLRKDLWNDETKVEEIFSEIATHIKDHFSHLIFVRFEPAFKEHFACYDHPPFVQPAYYLQPRFNQLITLLSSSEELLTTFSSDIKHDIRAAERLGITVKITCALSSEEFAAFERMKDDTRKRSEKNIFPSGEYFNYFQKTFRSDSTEEVAPKGRPRLCYFIASNAEGVPVAMNLNLLFGDTLTYLYGASYTGSISKRAPAYLHWKTMEYARERGFTYYDLGGVDDTLWHGLTYFKRQFGGETLEYIGTVDVVLRSTFYHLYNKAKASKIGREK